MKTLTEMLIQQATQDDPVAKEWEATNIKRVFKDWLKTVGLPDPPGVGRNKLLFSDTELTRQLLITLVDEP